MLFLISIVCAALFRVAFEAPILIHFFSKHGSLAELLLLGN
jgi:hypothetical protein